MKVEIERLDDEIAADSILLSHFGGIVFAMQESLQSSFLADDAGADEVTRLSVPDHLCATDAAKRAQRREQIDRLENVGLALRVVAEQQVKTGREIDVQPRVIAEITKSQMAQMHGEELLALPGDVKPQSVAANAACLP